MNTITTFTPTHIPLDLLNAFRAAGFSDHVYDGQDGVFIRKELTCGEMPNVKASLVDGDILTNDTTCVVEICPDQMLQLYIADTDYVERYAFKEHYEGWIALAGDAGVVQPLINLG